MSVALFTGADSVMNPFWHSLHAQSEEEHRLPYNLQRQDQLQLVDGHYRHRLAQTLQDSASPRVNQAAHFEYALSPEGQRNTQSLSALRQFGAVPSPSGSSNPAAVDFASRSHAPEWLSTSQSLNASSSASASSLSNSPSTASSMTTTSARMPWGAHFRQPGASQMYHDPVDPHAQTRAFSASGHRPQPSTSQPLPDHTPGSSLQTLQPASRPTAQDTFEGSRVGEEVQPHASTVQLGGESTYPMGATFGFAGDQPLSPLGGANQRHHQSPMTHWPAYVAVSDPRYTSTLHSVNSNHYAAMMAGVNSGISMTPGAADISALSNNQADGSSLAWSNTSSNPTASVDVSRLRVWPSNPGSAPSVGMLAASNLSEQQAAGYRSQRPAMPYTDDESRWHGVLNRSHQADRHYLYGAMTTHIYCRPSCASKRPSRDKIMFFSYPNAASEAELAGFRSCKRCRPDRSAGDQTVIAVGECVKHMMMAAFTSAQEGGEPKKRTLKDYAARAGLSTFHFHRSLAKVMSITPGEYAKACQSLALQDALGMDNAEAGRHHVSAKAYEDALAGWSARRAKRALGNVDPISYSRGEVGAQVVRTSVAHTAYGPVSIVYTMGSHPQHIGSQTDGNSSAFLTSNHPQASSSLHGGERVLYAVVFGPDADARLSRRFPQAICGDASTEQEIALLVQELQRTALREEQLPPETVASIRRARLWASVKKRLKGGVANEGSGGEDEHFE